MVYGLGAEEETTDVASYEHTAAKGEFLGRSVYRRLLGFPYIWEWGKRRLVSMSLVDQTSLDPGYRQ